MPGMRVVVVLLIAFVALRGLFAAAEWYADRVSLPRYCENREETLRRVARILEDPRPAGGEPTRAYAVAAKLVYLVPRRPEEPEEAYLARLRRAIAERCA